MKQRWTLLLVIVSITALFAFACKKETNVNSDTGATTDSSSTSVSTTDTSGTTSTASGTDTMGTTGTTSSTSTGATGGTTSSLSDADKQFVMKAAMGGMAEVQGGTTASQKATSGDVKAFGNRVVTDHGKANDELKQLATNKGMALPTDLDAEHKAKLDELSKKSGKDFDKAYIDDMVKDHEKDVKEFEDASKSASDPDLKAWAAKTLPTLQDHLKMAKDTQKKVK